MSAIVRLKLGDLFDGPSDLIVLPCSTGGTVTRAVADRLLQYVIPRPRKGLDLGSVEIIPFKGAENISQYVAFAVSVRHMESNETAIEKIGEILGDFASENSSVKAISAPLLGAGAGGLKSERVVHALSQGFRKNAPENTELTIHILHRSVFDRLSAEGTPGIFSRKAPKKNLRVFISYSGTNENHKKWVADLGTFLRANGINARLDQWHLRKGMDLPQWMTNELDMAERVIIITDKRYADRANRRSGGVGWETMLIQGDMYEEKPDSRKFIVIVREDDFSCGVPQFLKTKFCIHWTSNSSEASLRNDLLKELYDVELAPPIGKSPILYFS